MTVVYPRVKQSEFLSASLDKVTRSDNLGGKCPKCTVCFARGLLLSSLWTSNVMVALKFPIFLAPDGCLQYFRERRGIVNSFNWDPSSRRQYVPDQNYAICFKRSGSDCRIDLRRSRSAPAFSTSVGRLVNADGSLVYSTASKCGLDNGRLSSGLF